MKLQNIDIIKGSKSNMVRLVGEVTYDDNKLASELYWYEIPKEYEEYISDSGNPWLVCLLALAMKLNEPLILSQPIDKQLLNNCHKLMKIWKGWYPHLFIVNIEADLLTRNIGTSNKNISFYSGGIDSNFTILKIKKDNIYQLDDLITTWGFDITCQNNKAFEKFYKMLKNATAIWQDSLNHFYVKTNIKETRLQEADWAGLFCGAAIASVALVLERRYKNILISSTGETDSNKLVRRCSTPITDPLYSTSTSTVIHYGTKYSRIDKTNFVSAHDHLLPYMKVCANSRSEKNCGQCNKCYRTMINLYLNNCLYKSTSFPTNKFEIKKIPYVYHGSEVTKGFFEELQKYAEYKGREDISKAIAESFIYTKRLRKWLKLIELLNKTPLAWRLAVWFKNRLAKKTIF